MAFRSGVYIVPTNRWYIERTVWLIAGVVLMIGTALARWVNPWFVLLVVATGIASIVVSLTGFCVVGNVLYRFGFQPALARPAAGRPRAVSSTCVVIPLIRAPASTGGCR